MKFGVFLLCSCFLVLLSFCSVTTRLMCEQTAGNLGLAFSCMSDLVFWDSDAYEKGL